MQIPSRLSPRFGQGIAALMFACMLTAQNPSTDANESAQQTRVEARRGYLIGSTDNVRKAVNEQASPHIARVGNDKQLAEFGTPPPPCGFRIQSVFAKYCTSELRLALTPCTIEPDHVLCSTDYLAPRENKIFWRLRYLHLPKEVSLELEAVRRDPTGRLEEIVPQHANEFEELWDQLLMASRCKDTSQ